MDLDIQSINYQTLNKNLNSFRTPLRTLLCTCDHYLLFWQCICYQIKFVCLITTFTWLSKWAKNNNDQKCLSIIHLAYIRYLMFRSKYFENMFFSCNLIDKERDNGIKLRHYLKSTDRTNFQNSKVRTSRVTIFPVQEIFDGFWVDVLFWTQNDMFFVTQRILKIPIFPSNF